MVTTDPWTRADKIRGISTAGESRGWAGRLAQYAAQVDDAVIYKARCRQARHEYERVASFG